MYNNVPVEGTILSPLLVETTRAVARDLDVSLHFSSPFRSAISVLYQHFLLLIFSDFSLFFKRLFPVLYSLSYAPASSPLFQMDLSNVGSHCCLVVFNLDCPTTAKKFLCYSVLLKTLKKFTKHQIRSFTSLSKFTMYTRCDLHWCILSCSSRRHRKQALITFFKTSEPFFNTI